jgi:hypothetical protein
MTPEGGTAMPRTLQEILDHAQDLAEEFESDSFDRNSLRDAQVLRELSRAVQERAAAELRVADAVAVARATGASWSSVGLMLGTSGEAARQRYGSPAQPGVEERLVDLMAALEESVRGAKEAQLRSEDAASQAAAHADETSSQLDQSTDVDDEELVDLMAALEESVREAKEAQLRSEEAASEAEAIAERAALRIVGGLETRSSEPQQPDAPDLEIPT